MKKFIYIISTIILAMTFGQAISAQETDQDEVQEVVEERLQQAANKLRAYVGTVTDKTEDTMQLESDENEIKLVSVNLEETSFAKTNGSSETINFEDVGIGDYVITMGTLDDNNVLAAQRIVVSPVPDELENEAVLAEVTLVNDEIQVELKPDNIALELDLASNYDITETDEEGEIVELRISSLDEGDRLILVGVRDEDVFVTHRIHVIEQASET